ncbi:hypothetical protein FNF27_04205 [Cafeteria roenbergensis]|uniref:Major facilitator superfamily (MFS) profile domain-containing protein n=1 Tax=Cafeteria roenbergensis TaxID=33653 RepID=A0A5A8DNL4_CAFRO|nr:hypothetical protein FNF29_02636 [Cafeteria roenbergensis]KAA0166749.1 hypothetical protein FNF31_01124 [Cafeteria roenbergensis]KAA0174192.1 hypothetical protein FNF27_04205 [Cafeteria roenbergensis]|eukprot:KAA0154013.1 hypothetical protein FNF29_02636 [Cafeteria roenbergensis]
MVQLSARTRSIVTAIGFLTGAYDMFILNIAKDLIVEEFPPHGGTPEERNAVSSGREASLASMALIGAVVGQLVFGALADQLGRRFIFVATLACVTAGSFLSAAVSADPVLGMDVFQQLSVCRLLLGLGIGGEYPLSATVTAEASAKQSRTARSVATVFAMQGVGSVMAGLLTWIVLIAGVDHSTAWRLLLALGGVPGLLTLPWRWCMNESEAFRMISASPAAVDEGAESGGAGSAAATPTNSVKLSDVVDWQREPRGKSPSKELGRAIELAPTSLASRSARAGEGPASPDSKDEPATALQDKACGSDSPHSQSQSSESAEEVQEAESAQARVSVKSTDESASSIGRWASMRRTAKAAWDHRGVLAGTAGAWFLFDVAFYGVALFSGRILEASGGTTSIADVAGRQALLSAIGALGHAVAILTIERLGVIRLQVWGFLTSGAVFFILAGLWAGLGTSVPMLFLAVMTLATLLMNAGPNTTTFVAPSLIFPTEARATCHGLSAATGKAGAAVGTSIVPILLGAFAPGSPDGLTAVLVVCGSVMVLGAVWSRLFIGMTRL